MIDTTKNPYVGLLEKPGEMKQVTSISTENLTKIYRRRKKLEEKIKLGGKVVWDSHRKGTYRKNNEKGE